MLLELPEQMVVVPVMAPGVVGKGLTVSVTVLEKTSGAKSPDTLHR